MNSNDAFTPPVSEPLTTFLVQTLYTGNRLTRDPLCRILRYVLQACNAEFESVPVLKPYTDVYTGNALI